MSARYREQKLRLGTQFAGRLVANSGCMMMIQIMKNAMRESRKREISGSDANSIFTIVEEQSEWSATGRSRREVRV